MSPSKTSPNIRKRPRQERSRQTVAAILDAAVQVFAKRGYAEATTTRIAERAGVSVGSLYQYFPNKDALLLALTERHIEEGHARVREVFDEVEGKPMPLYALIERLVCVMVDLHLAEPDFHRVLFEQLPRRTTIEKLKAKSKQQLLSRFEQLLRGHPDVVIQDAHLAVLLVAQALESLSHWYVLDAPKDIDRRAFTHAVTSMLCATLVTPHP